jgi:protein phosphatase
LGLKPEVETDLFPPLPLRAADRIILCSDGLTTPLSDAEIGAIAGQYSAQQAAKALVNAANDRGGPDNVSVIVIEVKPGLAQGPDPTRTGSETETRPDDSVAALFRLETWQRATTDLRRIASRQGERLPPALFFLIVALIILGLIGLGFALGQALF